MAFFYPVNQNIPASREHPIPRKTNKKTKKKYIKKKLIYFHNLCFFLKFIKLSVSVLFNLSFLCLLKEFCSQLLSLNETTT